MLENMNKNDSARIACCMICFVFIFIILIVAICWTNYENFENFGNMIKHNHETLTNVLSGGIHYMSINPNDNILTKFETLKKTNKTALVAVLAPWCGYCKKLKSSGVLNKIAKTYHVLVIDDKHSQTGDVMQLLQAEGFPALGIFGHGKLFPYKGSRTYNSIIDIMNQFEESSVPLKGKIINVPSTAKTSDVSKLIKTYQKEGYKNICMVHMADWCGHCKHLKESRELEKLAFNGCIVFVLKEGPLTKHYKIKGFPTIVCIKNGKEVQYEGPRTADSILRFMS